MYDYYQLFLKVLWILFNIFIDSFQGKCNVFFIQLVVCGRML